MCFKYNSDDISDPEPVNNYNYFIDATIILLDSIREDFLRLNNSTLCSSGYIVRIGTILFCWQANYVRPTMSIRPHNNVHFVASNNTIKLYEIHNRHDSKQ